MNIAVHRITAASPDTVWNILTDLDGSPDTLSLITSVTRTDGGGEVKVGTTWDETRTMGGKTQTQTMRVIALDPAARRYEVMVQSMGQEFRTVIKVTAEGDTSRIEMTIASTATGLAAKVFNKTVGKAIEGPMTKVMGRDLSDICAAAEAA
jgi:carbon monoxide dehydrogenase subunit G